MDKKTKIFACRRGPQRQAARILGWQAKHQVEDVIDAMCRAGEAHVRGNLTAH